MKNTIIGLFGFVCALGAWQTVDIVVIPPGVLHVWTEIPEQVTYLSVRPDPDRVLPGGYVNPLLLKNQLAPVK